MKKAELDEKLNNALKLQQYKYPMDTPLVQKAVGLIKNEIFSDQKYADVFGKRLSSLALEYRKCNMDEYEYQVIPGENSGEIKRLERKTLRQADLADRIGISRQVFVRDLKGFTASESKRRDYYEYRRKYLVLYSLFFQVSPRYLMGLTDEMYDFGEIPANVMNFENDAVIYSYNLIVKRLKTAESEEVKEEIVECLKKFKRLDEIKEETEFKHIYAWLHMIPAVSELASKAFSVEYDKLDTSDWKTRDAIDKELSFNLFELLSYIDEHDRKVLFLLTSLIDSGKHRLLRILCELFEEGGFWHKTDEIEDAKNDKNEN